MAKVEARLRPSFGIQRYWPQKYEKDLKIS
jgi:hypothetical protein